MNIVKKRTYETENDYILDILEKEEDELIQNIYGDIPESIKFKFTKLLAIRNAIEVINIKYAFEEGVYSKII